MVLPKRIDDQLRSIEHLISGSRLLQLGTILLFTDAFLVFRHGKNLTHVDLAWIKSHLSLGEGFTVLLLFVAFIGVFNPIIQIILSLPSIIGSEYLINRIAKTDHMTFMKGVHNDDLLSYAIAENNNVAYQEHLRKVTKKDEAGAAARWSFSLLISLILDTASSSANVQSISVLLWLEVNSLPKILAAFAFLAIGVILLGLLMSSFVHYRYYSGSRILMSPRLYKEIKDSLVPRSQEENHDEDDT